jgi:hypothetical protein
MNEEFVKILLIIAIILVLIYFTMKAMKNKMTLEGLENMPTMDGSGNNIQTMKENGEAGNAVNYAAKIKNVVTKMTDTFLIDKYRKDYETTIINIDDLVDNLMLKTALNIQVSPQDPGSAIKQLQILNILNESKNSLNNVMKFIDKTGTSSSSKWL